MVATLANGWVRVAVPVSQLNPTNAPVGQVQLKNATPDHRATIWIDDVRLVRR